MSEEESVFLREAIAIGDHLAATAIQWRGYANWVAREIPERVTHEKPKLRDPHTRRLGHTLYDGVAGPALFLAHLSRFSGNEAHKEVAHGAVSEALRLSEESLEAHRKGKGGAKTSHSGQSRLGFYSGAMGPIWVAREAAHILGDPFLATKAKGVLDLLFDGLEGKLVTDLMAGHAGAIPALLSLHRDHGDSKALAQAVELGEQLAELAVREGDTVSWEGDKDWKKNLTGLSHGAAGYAYGMGLLYKETGKVEFRELAEGAIRYERKQYDSTLNNWPDYRRLMKGGERYPCLSIWCHGSGGIGISRVFLHPVLSNLNLLDEAGLAQRSLLERTATMLECPGYNYIYCHGVAGNAECLWMIEQGLGRTDALQRARAIGRLAIERFGVPAKEKTESRFTLWPTGIPGYQEISMFLGISGVGYQFLRLHAPDQVPTVLAPGVSHRNGLKGRAA